MLLVNEMCVKYVLFHSSYYNNSEIECVGENLTNILTYFICIHFFVQNYLYHYHPTKYSYFLLNYAVFVKDAIWWRKEMTKMCDLSVLIRTQLVSRNGDSPQFWPVPISFIRKKPLKMNLEDQYFLTFMIKYLMKTRLAKLFFI